MSDASLVIAVDGPAASGKGTVSRRLAGYYSLAYLDTGLLYRGVGWTLLSRNQDPSDAAIATAAAEGFDLRQIADADIRTPDVAKAASLVAVIPGVRSALLEFQRRFSDRPPGGQRGAVVDGRDIGTVVCPDAPVKLFVTASPEERARRRWKELSAREAALSYDTVLGDIKRRDARDAGRETAPMRAAEDAVLIDTTEMDPDTVFARACRVVDAALDRSGG